MAESVDALVSNTSAARRAGSTPAPGTFKLPLPSPFVGEVVPRAHYPTGLRFAVLRTALMRLLKKIAEKSLNEIFEDFA